MKLFQEKEAWALFKTAAIGESLGWGLLIYGIAASHYKLPGAVFMLPIGGSIHGLLFLSYLGVVISGFTSLNWSLRKAIFAVFLSVVPFATWMFEAWCANRRRDEAMKSFRQIIVKPIIRHGNKVLAVQLSTGLDWVIPGDLASDKEVPLDAAARIIAKITGTSPVLNQVPALTSDSQKITFYYQVENSRAYRLDEIAKHLKQNAAVDEIGFVSESEIPEIATSGVIKIQTIKS